MWISILSCHKICWKARIEVAPCVIVILMQQCHIQSNKVQMTIKSVLLFMWDFLVVFFIFFLDHRTMKYSCQFAILSPISVNTKFKHHGLRWENLLSYLQVPFINSWIRVVSLQKLSAVNITRWVDKRSLKEYWFHLANFWIWCYITWMKW